MSSIAATLEDLPTPMWIVLVVLGFVLWWPLGLAVLVYLLWSGRMMCCGAGFGRRNDRGNQMDRAQNGWTQTPTSGNRAFDEYRNETLRRLEEEQRSFDEFLSRLRMAEDKAEFDQFMAERTNPTQPQS